MSQRSNERIAFFNGKYVPESEVRVPFRDRSFLYGDGCFDMTRTFCVGPVPEELRRFHGDVLEAFARARDAMRPGTPAQSYQAMVCDMFERKGYPTLRSDPKTLEGYVHGLGHGVGLEIHEARDFPDDEFGPRVQTTPLFRR